MEIYTIDLLRTIPLNSREFEEFLIIQLKP